jgi:hypothetical protein
MRDAPRFFVLVAVLALLAGGFVQTRGPTKNGREIIIDAPKTPLSAPQGSSKPPAVASEEEGRAQDNALLAGAVEVDAGIHLARSTRRVDEDFSVKGGRCYYVSVAWKGAFKTTLGYSLGRSADNRPLNDGTPSETASSNLREGVLQFCVDRSGPARLDVTAEDGGGQADALREYSIVIGWRPETPAQRDARKRRGSAPKATVQKPSSGAAPADRPADVSKKGPAEKVENMPEIVKKPRTPAPVPPKP